MRWLAGKTPRETSLVLLGAGCWPIPIKPGEKAPVGNGWGLVRHTPRTLAAAFAKHPSAGIGISLGPGRGPGERWLIDIEGDGPEAEASLARLLEGEALETMGWGSVRGGHLLLVVDHARMLALLALLGGCEGKGIGAGVYHLPAYPGLEFRIGGLKPDGAVKQLQSVCPPTPGTDGTPRQWNGALTIADAPESLYTALSGALEGKSEGDRLEGPRPHHGHPDGPDDAARAAEALRFLPRNFADDYHTWIDVGFSLTELGYEGLRLWEEWSRSSEKFKDGECAKKWKTFDTHGKGLGSLFRWAREAGWGPPRLIDPWKPAGPAEVNEDEDDPHRLARLYLDQQCSHPDGLTLRSQDGEWLRWSGAWSPVSEDEVNAELCDVIKLEFDRLNTLEVAAWEAGGQVDTRGKPAPRPRARKVTRALVGDAALALRGYTRLAGTVHQPTWLIEPAPHAAHEILPTRNALVHLPTFTAGEPGAILPPTPNFFCGFALGYDFRVEPEVPVEWLRFLTSLWPEDHDNITCLQEWMGYLLTPDTRQQKILMMIGPTRSGKGTIERVIMELLGTCNVASPTLSSLTTQFGLAPLVGKSAAIITDARVSGRTDIAQVVERLLSISGEDSQTIDRKYSIPITVRLTTRLMVLSNELPRLSEMSGALASRMLVLQFRESFLGREDHDLERRLLLELPGILAWAIAGWVRLHARGHFVQPASGQELVEELEDLVSPVGMFVRQRCVVGSGDPGSGCAVEVPVKVLFEEWKVWCDENGREYPGDVATFGRNVRSVVPSLKTRVIKAQGGYVRNFVGIRLAVEF